MTMPDLVVPDESSTMAAELALGVLDGDERAAAMRRVLKDPDFAREVDAWRVRFAVWFAEWPDVTPSADVERRIVGAIDAPTDRGAGNAAGRNRWAWATGVATLIAACLVLALALRPQRVVVAPAPVASAAPQPSLVAAIVPTAEGAAIKPFAVVYDPAIGEIRTTGAVDTATGRDAELWVIGGEGTPHALGLLDQETTRVSIGGRNLARMIVGVTIAVSIEPEGGSLTGSPTGPVVATGTLARA